MDREISAQVSLYVQSRERQQPVIKMARKCDLDFDLDLAHTRTSGEM